MAAGAPVIVTDVGGLGPLVTHGETGWKVSAGDPDALAHAIQEALDDPAEARARGENGRRHVRETYSWDRVLEQTVAAYELAFAPV